MSWPTNLPNSAAFDADADSIAASRPELKKMSDAVNTMASNVYTAGSTTGTITPDVANGEIQRITLTGNITMNAFANPVAGQRLTMIFRQPTSGSTFDLTSTMLWENGAESLTQINSAVDTAEIFYDGTNYFARMNLAHGSVEVYPSGGLGDVVDDTTPQLGGDLDMNGKKIVTVANAPIQLEPNGIGDVELIADTIKIGDSNANATITTNGTGDLILNTNSGTNSGSIKIEDGASGEITLETTSSLSQINLKSDRIRVGNSAILDSAQEPVYITQALGRLRLGFDNQYFEIPTSTANELTAFASNSNGVGNIKLVGYTTTIGNSSSSLAYLQSVNGKTLILTSQGMNEMGFMTGGAGSEKDYIFNYGNTTDTGIALTTYTGSSTGICISLKGQSPDTQQSIGLKGNGDVVIYPTSSTGQTFIKSNTTIVGESSADAVIASNGANDLILKTNSGTNSGTVTLFDGVNGNIEIVPNGSGAIVCSDKILRQVEFKDYAETVYNQGNVTGSFSVTVSNGNTQRMRLTGSVTFTGFVDAREGQTITLLITQDGTGGRTFTEGLDSAGRMLFAGGVSTLSTAANSTDIMSISYIGGTYFASINKGYV